MAEIGSKFLPIWDDPRLNSQESNDVIDFLVTTRIKMLPLTECDSVLFEKMKEEAISLAGSQSGQSVQGDHPTALYVKKNDPSWTVKQDSIHQYSLYNSRDDLLFDGEDSHWHSTDRQFNSSLLFVPQFFKRYFVDSELQNFRMQSIRGGGDLGLHREKIVGIPNRPQHFKIRFHLPIVTNPGVRFMMDGQAFVMKEGWVYLFNQVCLHGVENKGDSLRIHLIFDCYLNGYILRELVAPAYRMVLG